MDIEFESLDDLHRRLEPALMSKVQDLKRNDYTDICEDDVWDFLSFTKWIHAENLLLHEMVDDILHADNDAILKYKEENR